MVELVMTPAPGTHLVRWVGDALTFRLTGVPAGCTASVRTQLGRAAAQRTEIIAAAEARRAEGLTPWHDLPMRDLGNGVWELSIPLREVGFFPAKAYATEPRGWQHWAAGDDFGVNVLPAWTRSGNTMYCVFPRQFGPNKERRTTVDPLADAPLRALESQGYAVLPPSGKLRDVTAALDHICGTLGFRDLLLLPVNPTPTTFGRFGRFGSPYAAQDLTAIDPALIDWDQRTTGTQQFEELAHALHCRGGRLFLDMVINHTGWGSSLWEKHPEWFHRTGDGRFLSPGAWGTVWEDLVELDAEHRELWVELAEAFLVWCRRGVDGFRCDAGYKVPVPVWRYITARVRREFPDTVFLLEGLGGSWEATEALLTVGGMQWAYSELFQNYDAGSIRWYLDSALAISARSGPLLHFSETHDNVRLASQPIAAAASATGPADPPPVEGAVSARDRRWSLLRNRLCALTSIAGGFAITNGVEWLATERVNVHSARGLAWGSTDNLIPELAALNALLRSHPAFRGDARLTRLSADNSPVYALRRDAAAGAGSLLVLVNTDLNAAHDWELPVETWRELGEPQRDLLGSNPGAPTRTTSERVHWKLPPGAAWCLGETVAPETPAPPATGSSDTYRPEIVWTRADATRVLLLPAGHRLLVRAEHRFCAELRGGPDGFRRAESQPVLDRTGRVSGHEARFPAGTSGGVELELTYVPWVSEVPSIRARVRQLPARPAVGPTAAATAGGLVLLTNQRGGMARIHGDLSRVESKYDCVLGANLSADVPCDRHVFIKRFRAWVIADGFTSALDSVTLRSLDAAQGRWGWSVPANGDRRVELTGEFRFDDGTNRLRAHFVLQPTPGQSAVPVRLVVRLDLEDRGYHGETKRNDGSEAHFVATTRPLDKTGFLFEPAPDRRLRVTANGGEFHRAPEWCHNLPHPVEASRGMEAAGDAWSPGWFELPLTAGEGVTLTMDAEPESPAADAVRAAGFALSAPAATDEFTGELLRAACQFVVRRGVGKTVIAGYPWFLDWGRDTLIACRGLLAGGLVAEVRDIALTFARFEEQGTLPNALYGHNASNRDTTDAPLWLGVVVEELAASALGSAVYQLPVGDAAGRTLAQVLRAIASGYLGGTPNGIHVDPASGLVWSPSHFTWMDTNHPAATPREGYPVEIQALWLRLLRQLAALKAEPWEGRGESWGDLARRAQKSFDQYFWLEEMGWYADVLLAKTGTPARLAPPSDALRSNALLPVALGLVTGERARRVVAAAAQWLLIPGALRSLAPLPVNPPLPVYANGGGLLNDPAHPYWSHYAGDEDTRRKPAYHNGTAWVWPFPHFCEALVRAYPDDPAARSAAVSYLGSVRKLLDTGCLGQLPEILDGDAPHTPRGCDAQAWSVTEVLRVWRWLQAPESDPAR